MDLHAGQPVLSLGPAVEQSRAVMLMLHGRNAGPANILELAARFPHPEVCFLAPAAAGGTWYPESFLSPLERNEPALSSALEAVGRLVAEVESRGVPRRRLLLLGFSQGACLASEFAVRQASRFGGLLALSGGLIGPPGTRWDYPGDFAGCPVFLGCSDVDAHVPRSRVDESAAIFGRMGAQVTERIYPGLGHEVVEDELSFIRQLLQQVAEAE